MKYSWYSMREQLLQRQNQFIFTPSGNNKFNADGSYETTHLRSEVESSTVELEFNDASGIEWGSWRLKLAIPLSYSSIVVIAQPIRKCNDFCAKKITLLKWFLVEMFKRIGILRCWSKIESKIDLEKCNMMLESSYGNYWWLFKESYPYLPYHYSALCRCTLLIHLLQTTRISIQKKIWVELAAIDGEKDRSSVLVCKLRQLVLRLSTTTTTTEEPKTTSTTTTTTEVHSHVTQKSQRLL